MWKIINTEQDFLFINIGVTDDIIVSYLTDLTNLWLEKLPIEQAHRRFKVSFTLFFLDCNLL